MKRFAVLILILLAGCATTHTVVEQRTETVILAPPPELGICAGAPPLPPAPLTDEAVGEYVYRLHDAHRDCAEALARMVEWGEKARARARAEQ